MDEDDPVIPDEKDWTWTLQRRCEECGLAAGDVAPTTVSDRAARVAENWAQVLRDHSAVNIRPEPGVWSPLEYGCHVRDVYRVFDGRLQRMLTEDNPVFDNWDQDAAAVLERYWSSDVQTVASELGAASTAFVTRMRALDSSDLDRPGQRSDGARFTVGSFLQYFLHDVVHHLWDVTRQQSGPA